MLLAVGCFDACALDCVLVSLNSVVDSACLRGFYCRLYGLVVIVPLLRCFCLNFWVVWCLGFDAYTLFVGFDLWCGAGLSVWVGFVLLEFWLFVFVISLLCLWF